MDFTLSDAYITHAGTGYRMHQQTNPVTTEVGAKDLNSLIWSMMVVLMAAGVTPQQFSADTPATYEAFKQSLDRLYDQGQIVSPERYGSYVGCPDDTPYIQQAINSGKPILFGKRDYICGPITIPLTSSGITLMGSGAIYYPSGSNVRGTIIRARDIGQPHIFKHADGADSIAYKQLRLDGGGKALKIIDGTYGAWITLHDCKIQNYVDYGFYNRQGLARIENCYFHTTYFSGLSIGASLFSDWNVVNSEFSSGKVPFEAVAGGGRAVNMLANSGTETLVRLKPLNTSTSHINTSFTNCYIGEVVSGTTLAPCVWIEGVASQIVQQVQFIGGHLVSARTAEDDKLNGGIYLKYVREVTIEGVTMLCLANSGVTATRRVDYFVYGENASFVNIVANVVKSATRNSVVMGTACYGWKIAENNFAEYAAVTAALSTTEDGAAIRILDLTNYGTIENNTFDSSSASSAPYAVEGGNPARFAWNGNLIRYASTTIWNPGSGTYTNGHQRMGSVPVPGGTIQGTLTYDPPSLTTGTQTTTTLTMTGVSLGDFAFVSFSVSLQGLKVWAYVSAADTVTVVFRNDTGATVDLASGTIRVRVGRWAT